MYNFGLTPASGGWQRGPFEGSYDLSVLKNGPLVIGRNKAHGLTDTRCSRNQGLFFFL